MRRGGPGPIDQAGLGRDPSVGVRLGQPAAGQALALDGRIAGDQPDHIAGIGKAALDELDRLDDDGLRACGPRLVDGSHDPRPDGGMDDRLEVVQGRLVGEDDPSERGPVERPVRAAKAFAEPAR